MADDVLYGQPASGATIATDGSTGRHFQRVKLVDGTEGSVIAVPGSASGLAVDVRKAIPLILDPTVLDSFGRLQVADPVTTFDSRFQYDLNPLLWQQITASGGTVTHLPNEATAQLSTTVTNGSLAALQTYEYFVYQPGKSDLTMMTFVMGAAQANVKRRVGRFDANNGIFLEQNGLTDLVVTTRSFTSGSSSDTRIPQASWNTDRLDGTGASGVTLDLSKAQILVISYQWLGVGRARIGFFINGQVYWAHTFFHANLDTTVYMTTGTLPMRYEMAATTGAAAATMKCICQTVISEGGFEEERGFQFSAGSAPATSISVSNAAFTPLMAIRPKALFNGLTNRGKIILIGLDLLCNGNSALMYQLVYAPATITGGAWVSADANSIVEYNNSLTAFTGGHPISLGFVSANKLVFTVDTSNRFPLTLDYNGANPIAMLLCAQSTANTGQATLTAMTWKELR